ncbi:hypothetical protein ASD88_15810 [Pelomonas sp. Root662]|nr:MULTISPECIES: DUF72 domain-containing protein [unclassified Roseateles]KQW43522.1 hypothetical protein ASC81_17290 [Pelomonas sp. Root405]KRA71260.1 hypothetical protein ASD88_15810 [Pelomonas sp. Root662]
MGTARSAKGDIRIGISGWRYEPWRGVFYPKGLAQRRELEFASRMVPTIEINGSFYSLQRPAYYAAWRDETPDDFVFAVKAPKYITHLRRLKEIETPLANFFANGIFELRHKLGPILWQFPPMLPFKPDRFEAFFAMLPHDTAAAARIAQGHDERVADRMSLEVDRKRPMCHAVEIRHPSFVDPAFIAMLRHYKIALVVADTAGKWPLLEDLTADFVYVRLHGDKELYASGYSDAALDHWAARVDTWSRGAQVADAHLAAQKTAPKRATRDVYCYFDNDVKVHAPYDAATLSRKLGMESRIGERGAPLPEWLTAKPRQRAEGFTATKKKAQVAG